MCPYSIYLGLKEVPVCRLRGAQVSIKKVHGPLGLGSRAGCQFLYGPLLGTLK